MNNLSQVLVWTPALLAFLGGVIGWVGSFGRGVRLLTFTYAACVIGFQHYQTVQALFGDAVYRTDWFAPEVIFGGLMLGTFVLLEIGFYVVWRPAPAKGGFWRRSAGLTFGLAAGWMLGVMLINGLYVLHLLDNSAFYGLQPYGEMLQQSQVMIQAITLPMLP